MMSFISLVGFVVAIIIFLNLLSAQGGKRPIARKDGIERERYDIKKIAAMKEEDGPRPRVCPVCGTLLSQTEYLIASIDREREGVKRQAHIYGCPHCYATDGVNMSQQLSRMEP